MTTPRGADLLHDPRRNKSTAFSEQEREALGLLGLLPEGIDDLDTQLRRALAQLDGKTTDLERYIYLSQLQDTDETLFYRVLMSDPARFMPIVYTPTVGEACQKFGHLFRRPRGLYVSMKRRGHLREILRNWPERDVRFIVVTSGERILGLGDLGANGMGIPIGKLALYTAAGGVPPQYTLPLLIDAGTDDEARSRIALFDRKGLVTADREAMHDYQRPFAQRRAPIIDLASAVEQLRPTAIIGLSTVGGGFDRRVIEAMARINERPMIFPYSNPTSRSECTAEEAYSWTEGRAVFAGGSPFPPVRYGGRTFVPGQGNNVYVFPAIGMAVFATGAERVTDEMFIAAAAGVAERITEQDLGNGLIYPPISAIHDTEIHAASRVAEMIFAKGLATIERPQGDLQDYIVSQAYVPKYRSLV